jgi:hypothetical protein
VLGDAAVSEIEPEQVGVGRRKAGEVVLVGLSGIEPAQLFLLKAGLSPVADRGPGDSCPARHVAVVQPLGDESLDHRELGR